MNWGYLAGRLLHGPFLFGRHKFVEHVVADLIAKAVRQGTHQFSGASIASDVLLVVKDAVRELVDLRVQDLQLDFLVVVGHEAILPSASQRGHRRA